MLELAGEDVGLPTELCCVFRELPLTSATAGEMRARWIDSLRGGDLDAGEPDTGPRSLVEDDLAVHDLAGHGSRYEMGLAVDPCHCLTEVGD